MRIRLTGSSSTLPDSVRGTSRTATTSFGTCRGEQSSRIARADPPHQLVVELGALAQHHEQRHVALAAVERHVDDQRVDDLLDREHGAVDLGRAHAHAAAVDRRVRAAADDGRAALGDLDPVAVAPDARVHVEVGLAVALAVRVVPQVERHRGHRLGDDQLADLADQRPALGVPRLDRGAQRARLQLALVHRQQRAAADEGRAEVGAAAGGEQPGVRADVVVDPAEAVGRQRRAGRADRAQRRQVAPRGGLDAGLHAGADVGRAGAEGGDPRAAARSHSTPMSGCPGLPS